LHSLALYILRRMGKLAQYPTDPVILDDWELDNIFDDEFSNSIGITPTSARSGAQKKLNQLIINIKMPLNKCGPD
jgi:hypothetical protein